MRPTWLRRPVRGGGVAGTSASVPRRRRQPGLLDGRVAVAAGHDERGARGPAHDRLGDAAQCDPRDRAPPARPEDEQVGLGGGREQPTGSRCRRRPRRTVATSPASSSASPAAAASAPRRVLTHSSRPPGSTGVAPVIHQACASCGTTDTSRTSAPVARASSSAQATASCEPAPSSKPTTIRRTVPANRPVVGRHEDRCVGRVEDLQRVVGVGHAPALLGVARADDEHARLPVLRPACRARARGRGRARRRCAPRERARRARRGSRGRVVRRASTWCGSAAGRAAPGAGTRRRSAGRPRRVGEDAAQRDGLAAAIVAVARGDDGRGVGGGHRCAPVGWTRPIVPPACRLHHPGELPPGIRSLPRGRRTTAPRWNITDAASWCLHLASGA